MSATGNRPNAESFAMELRRGAIVLCVLSELGREQYGYSLKRRLEDRGLAVPEGTLYPLLRRLESQGLLTSRWQAGEKRPRRYYRISPGGRELLTELVAEWRTLASAVNRVVADTDMEADGSA